MKTYEIWTEGYSATGESSGATFHGTAQGTTFRDAVKKFVHAEMQPRYFDEHHLTYWGCKFFDNGSDARKSFG